MVRFQYIGETDMELTDMLLAGILFAIIVGILSVWRVQDQLFNIRNMINEIHYQQIKNQ